MNEEREGKLKGILRKVLGIGRASVFSLGIPVTLALTFAVATTASAANGGNFVPGSAIEGRCGREDGCSE